MKRCRFGAGALVLLLILGLLCSRWTGAFFGTMAHQVTQAAQSQPEDALAQLRTLKVQWQQRRRFHAVLFDHSSLDEVDTLFALVTGHPDTLRENCTRLAMALDSLAQAQQPTLENLF